MVKLDSTTDFSKFRVSQLKEFLHDRDVNCIECTEKQDYVKKLYEVLGAAKTELWPGNSYRTLNW